MTFNFFMLKNININAMLPSSQINVVNYLIISTCTVGLNNKSMNYIFLTKDTENSFKYNFYIKPI
jgi:hypothetical protein